MNEKKLAKELEGKTVLITGASSGIGEQLAYLLADFNIHMILAARSEDKLAAMQDSMEKKTARVTVYRADLRNKEELEGLLALLHQLPGGLDIIVSNAGKSIHRTIYQSLDRMHDFTRTMAINYFAPVQLLLSTIPLLEQNQGHVINISTVNALLTPIPHWAAYQASKSAFDTWLRSAAPELNVKGIAVTSIYLPLVRTPMIAPTPAYRNVPAMCPVHVARLICRTMYTRRRMYKPWWLIFGQLASVMLSRAWTWAAPRLLSRREGRK